MKGQESNHEAAACMECEAWPPVETSWSGRIGFWHERSPAVFGTRWGAGPLVIALDTAILIPLRQGLEVIEDGALALGAQWSDRSDGLLVLRDLVQLWWWRDVRFWTSAIHLYDARKPLDLERRLAREAAVDELGQDFFERGGFEAVHRDDQIPINEPCPLHAALRAQHLRTMVRNTMGREPTGDRDRELLVAALKDGCHVFLTEDKGILRCHDNFVERGITILRPIELIEILDAQGELNETATPFEAPFPDVAAIARLYGAFGP